jgi:sugar lactone lactonase YvrE
MVVDNDGHAYIGNFGTTQHNIDVKPTCLIHVTPDGKASIVAENLEFPNGTVITPDGKKLIVGETYAGRLTAFDINSDKTLSNRQTWAKMMPTWIFYVSKVRRFLKQVPKETNFAPRVPDGICLDEGMGIWVASPTTFEVFRIEEGGNVTDIISTPQRAYACMLGGESGKTLYISTANDSTPEIARSQPMGKIYTTEVKFARAGNP